MEHQRIQDVTTAAFLSHTSLVYHPSVRASNKVICQQRISKRYQRMLNEIVTYKIKVQRR